MATFDEPIRVADDRQRLIVALVQKKVSELLREDRFKASFQIGMLASFESFLETAKLKRLPFDSTLSEESLAAIQEVESGRAKKVSHRIELDLPAGKPNIAKI